MTILLIGLNVIWLLHKLKEEIMTYKCLICMCILELFLCYRRFPFKNKHFARDSASDGHPMMMSFPKWIRPNQIVSQFDKW